MSKRKHKGHSHNPEMKERLKQSARALSKSVAKGH